ncbi:hypothetical protein EYF80_022674 [Liparis tanakae]|uniref:Uncharacterized protein n=1 Tax=Liparis tanakae TaxID=230148 RepID=A0A4Z2HQ96_9TELE|nr:hypothetical protein EYF80_022674 [Liparis tanakae]
MVAATVTSLSGGPSTCLLLPASSYITFQQEKRVGKQLAQLAPPSRAGAPLRPLDVQEQPSEAEAASFQRLAATRRLSSARYDNTDMEPLAVLALSRSAQRKKQHGASAPRREGQRAGAEAHADGVDSGARRDYVRKQKFGNNATE